LSLALIKVVKLTFAVKELFLIGYCIFVGGTYGTYLGDLAINGRMVLKWNLGKLDWKAWTLSWCMIYTSGTLL